MPIYAYHCDACGYERDVLQKLSDPALTECPQCGKPSFHKMVTAPAFELKGSGWYATDFAGKKPAAPAPAKEDAPAKPAAPAAAGGCGPSCACH